jgi:hypothetical protein
MKQTGGYGGDFLDELLTHPLLMQTVMQAVTILEM